MIGAKIDPRFAKLTVLLVEDDGFALKLAQSVLKNLGVGHVVLARDGAEAIRVLDSKATKADLIISDWNMPNVTGLDLLRHVRKTWQNMPFIMLTGRASEDFVLAAKENGVNGYVVKPFSPDQLMKKIQAVFNIMTPEPPTPPSP
ncbi:MAG: response regulator [Alphaproteobacteria bacterium]|nr:response regulator [Alphaproteobacteria bacterium]